jgi:phospholipid/cholesterol/gamma-HCH transport system permease protein
MELGLLAALRQIGQISLYALARLGRAQLFLLHALAGLGSALARPHLSLRQLYLSGVLSLPIIVVAGSFVGMVLALQGYYTLAKFGAAETLGTLIALSLTRELGPVVAALLFAGRAGSALTAEIGLMKATDQLASLEIMAIDPMRRVVAPRLLAGVIALPLLTALFSAAGILGGYVIGVGLLGVDDASFWGQMQAHVDWYKDTFYGVFKSLIFGLAITWIALFEGYDAVPTAAGVSRATTRSVVNASLTVLGLDFILTALMLGDD